MKGLICISALLLTLGLVLASGCTGTESSPVSGQNEPASGALPSATTAQTTSAYTEVSTEAPTEAVETTSSGSAYTPLWPAGTLLSDCDGKGWGLITKVKADTSEYCFRNVIHPVEGQPYIIKDSTFEEMGTLYSAKGIDNKYINYEGRVVKMPVTSKTGSTITGYLEYDTLESMKHTVNE